MKKLFTVAVLFCILVRFTFSDSKKTNADPRGASNSSTGGTTGGDDSEAPPPPSQPQVPDNQDLSKKPDKKIKTQGSEDGETDERGGKKPKKMKFDTKGDLKVQGKKSGKKFPRNNRTKTYMYKGKLVTMNVTTDFDKPPKHMEHANFSATPTYGKSCRIRPVANQTTSATAVNRGPSAEGITATDFKPCQERKRGSKKNRGQGGGHSRKKRAETYSSISWLWPDPENIPIMFDSSYPLADRAGGRKAWQYWQNNSCLRFVEKPTGTVMTVPYIFLSISGSGSCSTDRLGPNKFPPYKTTIDVTQCKALIGSVAHELGHALGLSHSQKRVDRDSAVNVGMSNIATSWQSQFERDNEKQFDEWGVPYYYDSIMHYYPYAATMNGLMTICPLDPIMEAVMGQREEPAFGDLSLINRIYCSESCYNRLELKTLNFTGSLSMTISGRICQNWSTQTPQRHGFTSVGNHDFCRNPDKWSGGPWCYTTDPAVPYEPCFAACEDLAAAGRPACRGWCYNGGFHDPDTCGCKCPRYASGEFCEIVDTSVKHGHVPCGGQYMLKKGFPVGISSPNWPHNYTAESLCVWWIVAPDGMKIRANFSDFLMEVPDETGCYDYLEIRPSVCAAAELHPEEMRFCGNSMAPSATTIKSIMSVDKNLVLKFVSDDHENARGFNVILEAV